MEIDSPAFETVARWRHEAFLAEDGIAYEESRASLRALLEHQGYEVALLAEVGGEPAGICLFVRQEIDSKHDLTPWLASLYVAPAFRNRSIGQVLVRAIEAHARDVGCGQLYLYTVGAELFYARLGWIVRDRFDWHGTPMVLMGRALA